MCVELALLITALKKDNWSQLRSSFRLPVLIAVQDHRDPPSTSLPSVELLIELLSVLATRLKLKFLHLRCCSMWLSWLCLAWHLPLEG